MEVHICNPGSKGLRMKKFKADESIQEDNIPNKEGYNSKCPIFLQLQTVECTSVLVCLHPTVCGHSKRGSLKLKSFHLPC